MKLNASNNWEILSQQDYMKFGIIDSDIMKCESAFLKNYRGQNITITLYNYGVANNNSLDEIERELSKIDRENQFIDGNLDDENYEDTSIYSCIFTDRLIIKGYECLALVSKLLLPEGNHSYVFQLYARNNGNLYSVQFKFANFDENNIEKSLSEDETFSEVLEAIY